jgi:hypothetical protein
MRTEYRTKVVMRKDGRLFAETTGVFEDRDRAVSLSRPDYAHQLCPVGYEFVEAFPERRQITDWERDT